MALKRKFKKFFREIGASARGIGYGVVARAKNIIGYETYGKNKNGVVVTIPGYALAHGPSKHFRIKSYFADEGYKVYAYNPGRTIDKKIEAIAWDLSSFIEDVCKKESEKGVFIVAHSMGGLVARYCLEECGHADQIYKIFSLATPYYGTKTARLARHTVAGREMVPKSDFLQQLAKKRRYVNKIISIRARKDQAIRPVTSSILEGAINIEADVVGHNLLKDDKVTAEIILKYLTLAKK